MDEEEKTTVQAVADALAVIDVTEEKYTIKDGKKNYTLILKDFNMAGLSKVINSMAASGVKNSKEAQKALPLILSSLPEVLASSVEVDPAIPNLPQWFTEHGSVMALLTAKLIQKTNLNLLLQTFTPLVVVVITLMSQAKSVIAEASASD